MKNPAMFYRPYAARRRESRARRQQAPTRVCKTLLGFFIVINFLIGIRSTYAATGLSIQPVKISYTLTPGQTVNGTIVLSNASDDAVQVETSIQDFIPTAGSDSIQFVGRAPGVTSVEDWISLGTLKPFIFQKGESRQISYTIKVPTNAEPGSHLGVIFFKATKLSEVNAQLKIGTQVGMLVFVAIPGDHLENGRVLDFTSPKFIQNGPVPFTIKFENTGSVHFEPKGDISIFNIFGKKVASIPIEGEVVLPTGVRDLKFLWNTNGFLLGYYKAVATVRDDNNAVLATRTIGFYALPIWYLVGFLVILFIIYFLIRFIRKKVNITVTFKT